MAEPSDTPIDVLNNELVSGNPTPPDDAPTEQPAAAEPEKEAAAPEPILIQPFVVPDGYTVTINLSMDGYASVALQYRPITKRMWREFYDQNETVKDGPELRNNRDAFVVKQIVTWSLPFPPTVDALLDLHPDGYADAILSQIQYGGVGNVNAKVDGPADVEGSLKN